MRSINIKVAIIEDQINESNKLKTCLFEYERKQSHKHVKFDIKVYSNAEDFLNDVQNKILFDIVFIDIELPFQNGMEAAFTFRKTDQETPIIFVTNMAQYAIKGYQVSALGYILKPFEYGTVAAPLDKAVELVLSNTEEILVIQSVQKLSKISSKDLMYVEVTDHKLSYHTTKETLTRYGSLADVELKLKNHSFLRCNSSYLVNPKYIKSIENQMVVMKNNDQLKISRPRKKQFMRDLTEWLGKGNII